ncbi:peptidase, M28 family [Leptospira interrogans str. UI 13372]|nr:peptidase, M28 family [Leptospira interrogans str. UI 13372]
MSSDSVLQFPFSYIDKIYNHIIALCEFDRLPGSPEYDLSLDYVISELKNQNCELNVLSFLANDSHWNWTLPVGMSHWKDGRDDTKIKFYNDRSLKLLEILIPGESEKEIFFITHLCHPKPSANDNASGPAMFIELIRYYSRNQPSLSLRFLFTVEYWGTIAYFSKHLDVTKNCIAGISLDMVGGDQNLAGSTMIVDEIPHHLTSSLDLFLYDHMNRFAHAGKYRMVGEPVLWARTQKVFYTGGSDHYILNDSTVAIPSTCLNTYPDRFYHRPEDTPDKISKDTLNLFFPVLFMLSLILRSL